MRLMKLKKKRNHMEMPIQNDIVHTITRNSFRFASASMTKFTNEIKRKTEIFQNEKYSVECRVNVHKEKKKKKLNSKKADKTITEKYQISHIHAHNFSSL